MAVRRRVLLASVQLVDLQSSLLCRPASSSSSSSPPLLHSPQNADPPAGFRRMMAARSRPAIAHVLPRHQELRGMSCCAGLGSPPPREIIVEYSEEDEYTDDFIKLANAIEEAYPEFVVSGNPDVVVQPRKGAFEISSGDSILFSKLKMNRMPELAEVLRAIDSLPLPQCTL